MSWTDFYLTGESGSSDLNAGSTTADVGGGSGAAIYTSVAGNFDGTSVFTPTDGSTPANTVSAGMYVALYNTADTVCRAVAKVVSVGAGVNGIITIDTTIKYGTVPTSNSGSRALKCGGAWNSMALGTSPSALNVAAVAPQSTRINVKAGTYASTTTSRTFAIAGSATVGLWIRGYNVTPGDLDTNNVAVSGTSMPLISNTTAQTIFNGAYTFMSNLAFTAALTGGNGATVNGAANYFTAYRCRFTTTGANANSGAVTISASEPSFIGCYFSATTTSTNVVKNATDPRFIGCVFSGGISAMTPASSTTYFSYCVFDSQAGDAINVSTTIISIVDHCSFYAPTGNGINLSTTVGQTVISNCYFENVNQASKAAINNTSGTNALRVVLLANAYFNCTANITGITESFTIFDNGTLASAGFVAPGSQNFTMAAIGQGLAFPGKFENTSVFQGYPDVGAVQHQGAGGGSTYIFQVEG